MTIEQEFKRAIDLSLKDIKNLGYIFVGITVSDSKLLGEFFIATFEAKKLDRRLVVSYLPKHVSIKSSIEKISNYFDFSDSGSIEIKNVGLPEFEGSLTQQLSSYLKNLEIVLVSDYSKELNGISYKSDPFDWSPYK